MHAVIRPEESSGKSHQFPIAGMVQRLDSGYSFADIRMLAPNVVRQLLLGIRWSGDKYGASGHDGPRHTLQKPLIYGRVTAATDIGLVMNMLVRVAAVDRRPRYLRGVELVDSCFVMVYPDHGVIMLGHERFSFFRLSSIALVPPGTIASSSKAHAELLAAMTHNDTRGDIRRQVEDKYADFVKRHARVVNRVKLSA
jgi:hypothetical protein